MSVNMEIINQLSYEDKRYIWEEFNNDINCEEVSLYLAALIDSGLDLEWFINNEGLIKEAARLYKREKDEDASLHDAENCCLQWVVDEMIEARNRRLEAMTDDREDSWEYDEDDYPRTDYGHYCC